MFEAVDGGGSFQALPAEKAVVKVQLETLKDFKQRIDGVLSTLDSSAASPKTVGADRIAEEHLGNGFAEAHALFATYNGVHQQLETFSSLLSDQIEAMQITVDAYTKGISHVDLEQRERVWAIHRRTAQYNQHHHTSAPTSTDPSGAPGADQTSGGYQG